MYVNQAKFTESVSALMFDRKVDPFLQYIEDLDEWDPETDIDRLNTFLTYYMGAEDNDLSQWASRFML